jgi:DNA-directed RNA polymerase specialized sigma24 family protein
VLDFWQPDQDQQRIDVIADTEVPTPAEILDMKDRQKEVYAALGALPVTWRENFVLFAVERWPVKEIADWRGVAAEAITEELRSSQKFILERLREKLQLEGRAPRQLPHTHDRG